MQRVTKFAYSFFDQKCPEFKLENLTKSDQDFVYCVWKIFIEEYRPALEAVEIKKGLKYAMDISHLGNGYM